MSDTSDTEASGKVNLGKGRPTPKRRDAEKRRGGPVAPPPTSRREAAKRLRDKQAADRASGRGLRPGEGDNLLVRDRGPVRAMIRDVIDGRRNLVLLVLPIIGVYFFASISHNKGFVDIVLPIYLGALLMVVFDLVQIRNVVSRRVAAEFPDDQGKGHVRYAILRAISFRKMRVPSPRVSPGPLLRRKSS